MSSDSTKNIANICSRMREVSITIRNNNPNSRTLDIPDVLEISSNLLSSVVSLKVSLDDSDRKIKDQREKVDEMINQKEHEFIRKMDQKIENVASNIDQIQEKIKEKEAKLSKCLNATQKIHKAEIHKLENDHESRLQKLNDEFLAEKKKISEQEKVAYIGLEKSLASHLSELSAEWNKKIQEIDDKIASYQKGLHSLIHDKHQQSQIKNEMLMNEDRRMASEHERISIEFRNKKEEVNNKIKDLTDQYQTAQNSLKEYSKDAQIRLDALEKNMLSQRREVEEKRQQQLFDLSQRINNLSSEAATKKLEIDGERSNINLKVREIEKDYEIRFSKEEEETKKMLGLELKKLEDHYNPKISELSIVVQEADLKRAKRLEELRKACLSDAESGELEVSEMNKKNEIERNRYSEILRTLQAEYDQLVSEKEKDLEELRQRRQKEISDQLTVLDDEERIHNEEVSNLMRQFDDQQKKLSDFKRLTLEQRNRKKADEIALIEQEHERRKNQILFNVSQQIKLEEEKKMNEMMSKENDIHSSEITSLQSLLLEIKGRMDALNAKMEDLCKANNDRFRQILNDNDMSLFDDLQKLKENDEFSERQNTSVDQLKSRILTETEEVKKRKYLVLKEVDQLDHSIQKMHDDFEQKLQLIESQFNSSKNQIQKDQEEAASMKEKLTNQIGNQKEKIEQLDHLAFQKVDESMQIENSFNESKEKFRNETEQLYKENLNEAQKEPSLFQQQIEDLRNKMTSQISELKRMIQDAKERNEDTLKLLLVEREQEFEEAETELRLISEEKKKKINEEHEKKCQLINNELEEALKIHLQKVEDLNRKFEEQFNLNEDQFNSTVNDLIKEKNELEDTANNLDNQIIELTTKECPRCTEKKEILRGLIKKRDELQKKLDNLHKVALASEKKMSTMFTQNDQRKTTSALSSLMPKAKILMPKKNFNETSKF